MTAKILIVEDSPSNARTYQGFLKHEGYEATIAATSKEASAELEKEDPSLVLLDLHLPDGDGMDILAMLQTRPDPVPVIVITANASLNVAVKAMRAGAMDFLVKPFDKTRLIATIEGVLERSALRKVAANKPFAAPRPTGTSFVGSSRVMRAVYKTIEAVATSDASVFITGESGTGKEVAARAVHNQSRRADATFHAMNCGAIPSELMESELFGHVKGAFTGASSERIGAAGLSDGGTLFLDELAEMPIDLQTKLLRFIQLGEYQRVGESKVRTADIRFISATNKSPLDAIANRQLREDLYYRLNVIPIEMPPLRERGLDIIQLAEAFMLEYASAEGKSFESISPAAKAVLQRHDWPGNVRQLQNVIRNAVVLQDAPELSVEMLPHALMQSGQGLAARPGDPDSSPANDGQILPLAVVERRAIEAAIAATDGNIQKAARLLEIDPSTIHRRRKAWLSEAS